MHIIIIEETLVQQIENKKSPNIHDTWEMRLQIENRIQ